MYMCNEDVCVYILYTALAPDLRILYLITVLNSITATYHSWGPTIQKEPVVWEEAAGTYIYIIYIYTHTHAHSHTHVRIEGPSCDRAPPELHAKLRLFPPFALLRPGRLP